MEPITRQMTSALVIYTRYKYVLLNGNDVEGFQKSDSFEILYEFEVCHPRNISNYGI